MLKSYALLTLFVLLHVCYFVVNNQQLAVKAQVEERQRLKREAMEAKKREEAEEERKLAEEREMLQKQFDMEKEKQRKKEVVVLCV